MKRVGGVTAAVAMGVLVLAGCGSDLESDDPQGYKACDFYERSMEHSGDIEQGFGSLLISGEAASKAKTEAIRGAAKGTGDGDSPSVGYLVDEDAMRSACADAGYEFKD